MCYPGSVVLHNGLVFPPVDGTLGADGSELGIGMNTLGSEAWVWTGD